MMTEIGYMDPEMGRNTLNCSMVGMVDEMGA
jgi:hypothetical protein